MVSAFENKILRPAPEGEKYVRLSLELGANFSAFAEHVLSEGEGKEGCLMAGRCAMDVHWMPFHAR